jgi:FtsP/CotA-like multicopper oxidase with cupredoxin domain
VDFDVEYSIVLSDWTFEDPRRVLWKLKTMEGYYNFQRPTLANLDDQMKATGMTLSQVIAKRLAWDRMRMDPTDIADITGATYSYLINGQTAAENPTFTAVPGQRVRLRIANASTMTFYDVRIPGLPMTVVQADGQNIQPVETDELRIAVAETYDVVVTIPDTLSKDQAYTLFAETMDRSGYARATLAPKPGMAAPVPDQRPRPMLTMADMGMMMDMDMDGTMKHHSHMDKIKGDTDMQPYMPDHGSQRRKLPTQDLPDRIRHGPAEHGPASITMARTAYRRLDYPGAGLGSDG